MDPAKKKRHDFSEGGVLFLSMPFLPMPSIHFSKSAGKSHHLFHITGQLLQANPAQKPGVGVRGGVPSLHIWDFSRLLWCPKKNDVNRKSMEILDFSPSTTKHTSTTEVFECLLGNCWAIASGDGRTKNTAKNLLKRSESLGLRLVPTASTAKVSLEDLTK